MASPLYRLILFNDDVGSQIFDDYDGWKEISLVLERDEEFHSVIELCESPLIFYGTSKDYIMNVIDTYGLDSTIEIQIDLSVDDGGNYTTIFEGVLSLEEYEEVFEGDTSYRLTVPMLPNEFWQKFKNRFDTPVEIGSTIDLDGGTRQTINASTLSLPSQALQKTTLVRQDSLTSHALSHGSDQSNLTVYSLLSYPVIELDELEKRFTYPMGITATSVVDDRKYLFEFKEAGDYVFSVRADVRVIIQTAGVNNVLDWSVQYFAVHEEVDGTQNQYSLTLDSGTEVSTLLVHDYDRSLNNQSITVNAGDLLFVYGVITGENAKNVITSYILGSGGETKVEVLGNTITEDSSTSVFRIHEAFNSVCNQIAGQDNSFYSPNMGNTSTQIQSYLSNSANSYIGITKGVNVRGYSLIEKPISASFKQLWDGINPIMNYGLGYDYTDDSPEGFYIEILLVEEFYVKDSHITLSNIENLIRTEDVNKYIKEIEIGYKKWKSEEIGGIDDPQTKHRYATRFKTFGKAIKLLSEFYTASLGIEVTRRKSIKETEDWKLDDEIFAIALDRTAPTTPDLDDDFSTISNLINPTTRYNLRLTPARALLRHLNILSAGLTKYAGSEFKFVGGEGNQTFTATQTNSSRGDYDNVSLAENADIAWDYYGSVAGGDQETIFIPTIYEFEIDLTYEQFQSFKNNRKRSFSISESLINYKEVFLLRLEYMPSLGKAKFKAIEAY